jgi:hypothetical protein
MTKFIREFQLFILIFTVIICTFFLSMRGDDTRIFPLTFFVGGLFVMGLCCFYPDSDYPIDEDVITYKITGGGGKIPIDELGFINTVLKATKKKRCKL